MGFTALWSIFTGGVNKHDMMTLGYKFSISVCTCLCYLNTQIFRCNFKWPSIYFIAILICQDVWTFWGSASATYIITRSVMNNVEDVVFFISWNVYNSDKSHPIVSAADIRQSLVQRNVKSRIKISNFKLKNCKILFILD